jgi:uncharacterized Zn finger protein/DNA-binding transcriptional regulator YiaG
MYGPYVSVAQKKARAENLARRLQKERPDLRPVCPQGRTIAASFWGKAWCRHLRTYADHVNRIGRGRSYVLNSAVCHLEVTSGRLEALVAGSQGHPYKVAVTVQPVGQSQWQAITEACAGRVGSMLDLLSGRFPKEIMARVSDPETGLFPKLGELKFACSCPDWAQMCKHVAAVLYALGHRLDEEPELLFTLRGVDPGELANLQALGQVADAGAPAEISAESLSAMLGIELDLGTGKPPSRRKASPPPKAASSPPKATPQRPAAPRAKVARASGRRPAAPPAFANPERLKGREIAALRKKMKLTVAEFAAALGSAQISVVRWEAQKIPALHQASKDKLLALAAKVGSGRLRP